MSRILIEEDWTFADADTRYLTHGFHPYPARMIPQVARRLSVLVESRLLNRSSIGVDVNPLACILAKAKTTPIESQLLKDYWFKFKVR